MDGGEGSREKFINWQGWVEERRWWILAGLVGVSLIGFGIQKVGDAKDDNRIEIIPNQISPTISKKIMVDVGGSVIKPGVYEFDENARVEDALQKAGGLAEETDHDWVSQSVNRAQKLSDGMKLYIFRQGEQQETRLAPDKGTVAGVLASSAVSLNSASQAELEALWGIGPATAKAIVDARPFSRIEELLEKKILKNNVFERNKEKLSL